MFASFVTDAVMGIAIIILGVVILSLALREILKPIVARAKVKREYLHWLQHVEPQLRNSPGYPDDWQNRRREVYKHFGGKCASCGTHIRPGFIHGFGGHVHHRIPISQGGNHSFENLELLCEDCHFKKHPGNNSIRFNRNRLVRVLALAGPARRARRPWVCGGCDKPILAGDKYYGGYRYKLCYHCRYRFFRQSKATNKIDKEQAVTRNG